MKANSELFAAKPEVFFPFAGSRLAELRQVPRLAIGELAGRDSIAAILAALASDDVQAVLPVAVYTGAEYGDWAALERSAEFLRRMAGERYGKVVLEPVWIGSPPLWRAVNGRYITEIVLRYGAYSPCLACHFYLHAMSIPLALQLGTRVVIGGDREWHDCRVKINQIPPVVDTYQRLFRRFELELREPLRALADTAQLEALLGPTWPGGSPQLACLFSGNYYPLDGRIAWSESGVMAFVHGFVYPVLERVFAALVEQRPVDYLQVAAEVLSP